MKHYILMFFSCFLFVNAVAQLTYSPNATSTITMPCGVTHTFTDQWGVAGNYSANQNYSVTFLPATAGQCISLNFTSFAIHNTDLLTIYDGPSASSPILGSYNGNNLTTVNAPLPIFTSTSGALTFVFVSNASQQAAGWEALIECTPCLGPQISMANGSQTLTCGTRYQFFDSGGQGSNYGDSENLTQTFYPSIQGSCMNIQFLGINTANNDVLSIYNGTSTAAPLVGTYVNQSLPPTFNANGPVTFEWTSNATTNRAGWYAIIQCTPCAVVQFSTVSCGTPLNFYDTGGSAGNYSNAESYTVTFQPSIVGQCLSYTFTSFATNNGNDNLAVYDGGTTASPLIGLYSSATGPPTFTTSGGAVTFVFNSDASGVAAGWAAVVACVNCSITSTTYLMSGVNVALPCPSSSLFYDSGGSGGNYANNQNFTKTFTAPAGSCLQVAFSSAFSTESCCDRLKVFDGPNGASPSLGTYNGTSGPGVLVSTGSSMTFSFTSDGSVVAAGWEATVTCVAACSGTPAGGTISNASFPCAASGSVGLLVNGSSPGCGLTYQWQSAPTAAGVWTNMPGATGATITVANSASTFFRRLTICGANTGTSSVSNATTTAVTCGPAYVATAITYSFTNFTGNLTPTTDDVLYNNIAMFGFPTCYGGSAYWGGYIASNSAFVFDAVPCVPNIATNSYAAPGIGTGWSITGPAPNTNEAPRNAILAPWHDTYPPAGGVIQYTTTGTAPNRVFIASWQNIAMYSCTTLSSTSQVKIFETTNIIEIHIGNKALCSSWNNGSAILGLHNFDGTIYTPPVASSVTYNAPVSPATNPWTLSNSAYRFTPNACAAGVGNTCLTLPIILKAFYGERKEKINHLYWETSQEKNVQIYNIERSVDGINFEVIGGVFPNNSPSKYLFDDLYSKEGIVNYYRISIVDKNASTEKTFIYPLGGLSSEDILTVISVRPNPSNSNFNVSIDSKLTGKITLNVYNSLGVIVKRQDHDLSPGFNDVLLNTDELPTGVYILSLSNNLNEIVSRIKLIKN